MGECLGGAHLLFEAALKCLLDLAGDPALPIHNTNALEEALRPEYAKVIRGFRGSLAHEDIQHWHTSRNFSVTVVEASKTESSDRKEASFDLFKEIVAVAIPSTRYAAEQFEALHGTTGETEWVKEYCDILLTCLDKEPLDLPNATALLENIAQDDPDNPPPPKSPTQG